MVRPIGDVLADAGDDHRTSARVQERYGARRVKRELRPRRPARQRKAATVAEYLAALPEDQRSALERLRRCIRAAAPGAEECISYGIPSFRLGRMLVGFAAAAAHCTFHLLSTRALAAHASDLEGYALGKGSIRFTPDHQLPTTLVRRLVEARLRENRALDLARKRR
jgi:uncharacterized protein YdhG (YjbR/CyaY superfamily)